MVNRRMKRCTFISNHQGNENQNHNELSPHTCQNGYHQKDHKYQILARMWRKRKPLCPVMGMQVGAATMETSMGFPQKSKNRATM